MNFKNLKLGVKLSIGFGVLILISMILGGLAVMNMSSITTESTFLAREYVPEVKMATELHGAANRVMYEMRGYGYTEEDQFYQNSQREIESLKKALSDGKDLNKRSVRLVKLAEEIKVAEESTQKYLKLVDQTVEVNKTLEDDRNKMDKAAALYMENCYNYLDNQNKLMLKEIKSNNTTEARLTKITLINDIIDVGNAVRVGNFKSQAKRDPKIFQEALDKFPQVKSKLEEIRTYTNIDSDLKDLDQIEQEALAYENAMNSFITNWLKREDLATQRNDVGKELTDACKTTADAGLMNTQNIADNAIALLKASSVTMITGLIFALIIGIVFAMFLTRIITGPINKGVIFAKQLSDGDLTATVEVDQNDEIGQLAAALTNMATKLREIVESIIIGADNIASASQQMSSTSQQMSQGASEQASSVEEVSSSMEEMSANIDQNTDNAQGTEKIALTAAIGIKEGSEATNVAVSSMKNIAEKIRIINDIAFQTNILALNAAVEAARAGEHGKGFAVVATEVRKLAERSKVAADEIDELSKNGVSVAEKAGSKLVDIVPDIEKTAQLVQEIASASLEQRNGAEQVNSAMQQLNNVTQQNAAASEEMATSSEELASQAEQLKDVIQYFKIGNKTKSMSKQNSHMVKTNGQSQKQSLTHPVQKAVNGGVKLNIFNDNIPETEFEKY